MSLWEQVRDRFAETAGKIGLATGVATEAGKASGFFDNVTAIQVISAAGVILMLLDRCVRIYWDSKEKGNTKMVVIGISGFWVLFAWIMGLVLTQ